MSKVVVTDVSNNLRNGDVVYVRVVVDHIERTGSSASSPLTTKFLPKDIVKHESYKFTRGDLVRSHMGEATVIFVEGEHLWVKPTDGRGPMTFLAADTVRLPKDAKPTVPPMPRDAAE